MKVRIMVTEFVNGTTTYYVQIKNSLFSKWKTLNEAGDSAMQVRADKRQATLRCPAFGTRDFAVLHMQALIKQECIRHGKKVKNQYFMYP